MKKTPISWWQKKAFYITTNKHRYFGENGLVSRSNSGDSAGKFAAPMAAENCLRKK